MAQYVTTSADETLDLGVKLGKEARAGQVYALDGDLGAGKTVLTRGIARGMGLNEADEAAFLALNPNGVVVDEDGDAVMAYRVMSIPNFLFLICCPKTP